jgi:hypothetical protein
MGQSIKDGGEKRMVYNELPNACDFCDKALRSPRFYLKVFREVGLKVEADYYLKVCEACYAPLHTALETAVRERIKQVFLEVTAKYRQDWQKSAAKI